MFNEFRLILVELLMFLQLRLAPKTPDGDKVVTMINNYLSFQNLKAKLKHLRKGKKNASSKSTKSSGTERFHG